MSTPTADSDAPRPPTHGVKPPPRRFRLIDLMILIAATALGFALLRWGHEQYVASMPPLLSPMAVPELEPTSSPSEDPPSAEPSSETVTKPAPSPPTSPGDRPSAEAPPELIPPPSTTVGGAETGGGRDVQAVQPGVSLYETASWVLSVCTMGTILLEPFMTAWTLALILIRLLRPRPRRERLGAQPGFMAMVAAAFAMIMVGFFVGIPMVVISLVNGPGAIVGGFDVTLIATTAPVIIGTAVAAVWLALIVGRRWRAEPHWIDRLGRIIGLYWIAASIVGCFYSFVVLSMFMM
jgi:hypothetical protein